MVRASPKVIGSIRIATLILVGLLGCVMVAYNTRRGAAVYGDSIVYIQGAKNLLAGNGYATLLGRGEVEKITGFPPMTSVALALTNLGLGDMASTGRWLNVILLGLNVFLAGWIVLRYTRSLVAAVFAELLVVANLPILLAHTAVMSEGLFILLVLLAVLSLAEALDRGSRWLLVLSGLLTALSTLTRYVGLIVIPVAGLGILFFGPKGLRPKLRDLLIFAAASLVPVALWILRNQMAADNAVNRQIGLHLMSDVMRGSLIDQVLSWFYLTKLGLPWRIRVPLFVLLYSLIMGWFVVKDGWFFRRVEPGARPLRSLPYLLAILLPVYVFAIWANSSILDPNTSGGAIQRYLTPVFVSTMVLAVCVAGRLAEGPRNRWPATILAALIGIGLIGSFGAETRSYLFRADDLGYGFTDNVRYWPGEVRALKGLDPDRPIVTNDVQLIYALCGRYAYPLPLAGSENGVTRVDADALRGYLAEEGYLVIVWRYGQTMADVFDEGLVAGYPELARTTYIAIYVDPAYAP